MKLFLFRWVQPRPRILGIETPSIGWVMCLCFSHNNHSKGQSFQWKTKLKWNEVKVFWFQVTAETKIPSSNFDSHYRPREICSSWSWTFFFVIRKSQLNVLCMGGIVQAHRTETCNFGCAIPIISSFGFSCLGRNRQNSASKSISL